ncbi:hypothetical protein LCGC14_1606510 [marine sediment metagenome]|uniref:pyruvate, water dikinase n=1 Tax=marine sediment metagenome TaxID=412755 RepID=A0A0F9IW70_9ZZZZ
MKKRTEALILPMKGVGIQDVALVGGKNASLGEMLTRLSPKGVRIPDGFIVTAYAYRQFISKTKLDEIIKRRLEGLNVHNVRELAKCGKAIREAIRRYPFPAEIKREIIAGYRSLEKQ